jgi:hypothetical protein
MNLEGLAAVILDFDDISPEVRQALSSEKDRLLRFGLLSEEPPPDVFVLLDSDWRMVDLADEAGEGVFVHKSILRLAASREVLNAVLLEWESQVRTAKRSVRRSVWRAIAIRTIFLPVWLVFDRPFPSFPGSRHTQGMAIVGFLATLALIGGAVSALFRNWIIAITCAYWWVGASLIRLEAKAQGLDV